MESLQTTFVSFVSIILLGYLAKRLRLLEEKDGHTLIRIIWNLTLPAVVILKFSEVEFTATLALLPLLHISYGVIMTLIGGYFFKTADPKERGLLTASTIGFNISLFAFPFVEAAWGPLALTYIALCDLGNGFVVFGWDYVVASHFSPQRKHPLQAKEVCLNLLKFIPLMCYVAALLLNFSGWRPSPESLFTQTLSTIARANSPLVLMLLGIYLHVSLEKRFWKTLGRVLLIRYVCGLSCGFLLYTILPLDIVLRKVLFVSFVLPIGMVVLLYAMKFGYSEKQASALVNGSNVVSFVLMWLCITLLG